MSLIFLASLWMVVLQEGRPLPGSKTGLLYNTWKWIVRDTCWQSKRFYWKERLSALYWKEGGEQEGKGTQENCSAMCLTVLGFTLMGLVSRLSLASHSDSEFFLVVHALFSQDGCQREGFWEVVRYVVFPFDLSWTLPVGGGLFCVLTRTFCRKTNHANGDYGAWPGWEVSVSVLPLTHTDKMSVFPAYLN